MHFALIIRQIRGQKKKSGISHPLVTVHVFYPLKPLNL